MGRSGWSRVRRRNGVLVVAFVGLFDGVGGPMEVIGAQDGAAYRVMGGAIGSPCPGQWIRDGEDGNE